MSEHNDADIFVDMKDIFTSKEVQELLRVKEEEVIDRCFFNYWDMKKEETTPTKVIYHEPATVVYWEDGVRTVAVCDEKYDTYDKFVGLNICIAKKFLGNKAWREFMMKEGEVDGEK